MLLSVLRYLRGYLLVRVTGYSPERFLNLCKNKKIAVWGLEAKHHAYEMYMTVNGFRKLKPILRKTKTKVTIEERFGLPFFFHKYRKRKLFFAGIFVALFLTYCLTFFLWDIRFVGNHSVTDNVLLEHLKSQNITHGILIQNIDCEQITKNIRKEFDDIIWVSASIDGTRLTIELKENTDTFEIKTQLKEPCDIISEKSGIVQSIVTRSGVPQVKQGEPITEETLLVSGAVPVLNDAKEIVTYNYVTADADIVLQRNLQYTDYIEKQYPQKKYTDKKRSMIYLKIGEYELLIGRKKNNFENKVYQTTITQLKLRDNFYLPLFWGRKYIREYKTENLEYSQEELETLLHERFLQYCADLEEEGAIITNKNLQITYDDTGARAEGSIELSEEVGIPRKIVDFFQPSMVE